MSHTAQNIDAVNDSVLMQSGACTRDTQNRVADRQGNWHFADVSGTHHTQTFVVTSLSVTVNTCNDYEPIDTCVSQGSVMTLIRRGG